MSSNDSTNSHPLLLDEAAAAERLSLSKHCLEVMEREARQGDGCAIVAIHSIGQVDPISCGGSGCISTR